MDNFGAFFCAEHVCCLPLSLRFIPVSGPPPPVHYRRRRCGALPRRTGWTDRTLDRDSGSVRQRGRPALPSVSRVLDGCLGFGNRIIARPGAGEHDSNGRRNRRKQAYTDIHVNGRDLTATNDSDGFRKVGRVLREAGATRAVMEATGRMHRALLQSLHARGFSAVVVNPRQARDLPKAAGALGRTDRVDARIPAAFGAAFPDMEATEPASAAIDRLRDMPGLRDRPVDQRAELRTVVSETATQQDGGPAGRVLAELDTAIAALERRIGGTVAGTPEFADSHRILTSVPGIGPVTAAALIAWMAELGAIGNRQAASLPGVAPLPRDSGTIRGGRHIGGGRRRSGDVACMAALPSGRCAPDMGELL